MKTRSVNPRNTPGVSRRITASWAPYVKNYGANITFDYGNRAATLWLER